MDFVTVAQTEDVTLGCVKVVDLQGHRIALCNVEGRFFAVDDVCTHDGGPLGDGRLCDGQIECPRHGGRFDVETGRAVVLPPMLPIRTYAVRVEGTEVRVCLERRAGDV